MLSLLIFLYKDSFDTIIYGFNSLSKTFAYQTEWFSTTISFLHNMLNLTLFHIPADVTKFYYMYHMIWLMKRLSYSEPWILTTTSGIHPQTPHTRHIIPGRFLWLMAVDQMTNGADVALGFDDIIGPSRQLQLICINNNGRLNLIIHLSLTLKTIK